MPYLLLHGLRFFLVSSKGPLHLAASYDMQEDAETYSNAVLLAKEQSLPISNVLGLARLARAGFELTTSRMLNESTTTRLQRPVKIFICFCLNLCIY
jgi:hypothetical protein